MSGNDDVDDLPSLIPEMRLALVLRFPNRLIMAKLTTVCAVLTAISPGRADFFCPACSGVDADHQDTARARSCTPASLFWFATRCHKEGRCFRRCLRPTSPGHRPWSRTETYA